MADQRHGAFRRKNALLSHVADQSHFAALVHFQDEIKALRLSICKIEVCYIYRVARECINTKVLTKSDVLIILLAKLASCAFRRQLQVFIDRLQELFLLARFRI